MMDNTFYLKEVQGLIEEKEDIKLFEYIEKNVAKFFSSADLYSVYQVVRQIDVNATTRIIPKLIKAWLAFLCGDNVTLTSIMKTLNESELEDQHERSMYCSLKAISGWNSSLIEREEYALLSVEVLDKEDTTFYMANALLTYGQMLASQDRFRNAAEIFSKAYDLFDYNNMQFPAVVSRVNELLNRSKLGEFRSVIEICQNLLIMSGQFNVDKENDWNVLHLPLGICYYELNKPHLAIKHLMIAKDTIERLKLFHMHGLIEIFMFKAFYILHDVDNMNKVYNDAKLIYEPMQDRMGNIILSMFYLLMNNNEDDISAQYHIQQMEMVYETLKENTPSLVIQTLMYLKTQGLSYKITQKDVNSHIERLRYIGTIPDLQMLLILNANIHQYENKEKLAKSITQEALELYKEFGISSAFNYTSPQVFSYLKKLDIELWTNLNKQDRIDNSLEDKSLLSTREKEIMQLIAKGKTNKEVGELLFIGVGTVKWHINNIFSKLHVENRVQAIEKARTTGEI